MKTRWPFFILITTFFLFSCTLSRVTTHWVVNNDSGNDVTLQMSVYKENAGVQNARSHVIKPGLQQLPEQNFSRGNYILEISDGQNIRQRKQVHFNIENWVIVNFTNNDSLSIQRKYGLVDTASMKKIDGKYTGIDIFTETRKPPFLYTIGK